MSMARALSHRGMGDAAYDSLFAAYAATGLSPAAFKEALPGATQPNPATCLQIQCGSISQAQAGLPLLAACSFDGFAGVRTCQDPLCAPYCTQTANAVASAAAPLPVAPRVAATFASVPARGCNQVYSGPNFGGPYGDAATCGCMAADFINDHPIIALALLGAAGWGIWKARKVK